MLNIFTDNWENPPILNDGERMLHIFTRDPGSALYTLVDDSIDDVDGEIRFALRHKYGKHYYYNGYEDVSYICEDWVDAQDKASAAWEDEGYYIIGWSDGGMDWTNNGPIWCGDIEDLATELYFAKTEETDTHVACAEKVAQFEQYELDALLGEFSDDYDIDGIISDATKATNDGNRYWIVDGDDLNDVLEMHCLK